MEDLVEDIREISGHVPGDDPRSFWTPWLGHWVHLTPADMGDVMITSYVAAWEWVKEQTGG